MENKTLTAGTVSIRFEPLLAQPCDRELRLTYQSAYKYISHKQGARIWLCRSCLLQAAAKSPTRPHRRYPCGIMTQAKSRSFWVCEFRGWTNLLQTLVTQFTALYGSSYKRTHRPHSHQASVANSSHFSWGQWFDILVLETMSTIINTMGNNSKTLVPPTYTNNSDHQNNDSLKWLTG